MSAQSTEDPSGSANAAAEAFWQHTLAVYSIPGFSEDCIELQDKHGFDVNLVLLCLWLASERKVLNKASVGALAAVLAPWASSVTEVLRGLRRDLKNPGFRYLTREDVMPCREMIKSAELEGERLGQKLLVLALADQQLSSEATPQAAAAISLAAYREHLGAAEAGELLNRLLRLTYPS